MPLTATQTHLHAAADLDSKKQYYEANLALKAVQDGLKIDTLSLVDTMPKSG
jgi:YfdX protein